MLDVKGGKYDGDFKDDEKHGFGTLSHGRQLLTCAHVGIETYANGHKYSGEFKNGKRHGKGMFEAAGE